MQWDPATFLWFNVHLRGLRASFTEKGFFKNCFSVVYQKLIHKNIFLGDSINYLKWMLQRYIIAATDKTEKLKSTPTMREIRRSRCIIPATDWFRSICHRLWVLKWYEFYIKHWFRDKPHVSQPFFGTTSEARKQEYLLEHLFHSVVNWKFLTGIHVALCFTFKCIIPARVSLSHRFLFK